MYCHLCFLLFLPGIKSSDFLVDIISPVSITMEYLGHLRVTGPAMDLAVEQLRERYGSVFQVRHTYIFNKSATSCDVQAYDMDDMLSKFYYKDKLPSNLTAVIFPGKLATTF